MSLGDIFVYTLGISLCHAYFTVSYIGRQIITRAHSSTLTLDWYIWIFSRITVLADIIKLVFK